MEIEERSMGDIVTVPSRESTSETGSVGFGINNIPEWNRVKLSASSASCMGR